MSRLQFYTLDNVKVKEFDSNYYPEIDDAIEFDKSQYVVIGRLFIYSELCEIKNVNYIIRYMGTKVDV